MDVNDDEPEDVKRATSVEKEIKKGEKDDTFEGYPRTEKKKERWQHCAKPTAKKKATKSMAEGECCERKKDKMAAKEQSKRVTVMVFGKPCVLPKLDIIPRHCLSKKEYIDMLATPSRRCPPQCLQEAVLKKLKPVSPRIKELARPNRQRMLMTLQDGASRLKPEFIDNLIKALEGETCLTPEQAAKAFRDQKRKKIRRKREEPRKYGRTTRKVKKPGVTSGTTLDKDAVTCQYLIAERFVKSILDWKCPIPKEEYQDIARVIIKRLSYVLEYKPIDESDRKSQQMRFLADVIACWIAGVLFEVAEDHKTELEEVCERKRKEAAEDEEEDEDEEETDEDIKRKKKDEDEEDEDEEEEEEEEEEEKEQEEDKEEEKLEKEKEEDEEARLQKEKEEEEARLQKEKEEEEARLQKEKEEEEARLQKEKEEEEEARLQKEKEEEEARLQKEKEEEEARLQKEKEEEEARLRKEKEEEEARLQKEKEEEEARLQKEKEEEEARLQKEKEEEEARLQKEKEEEEARLQKEKEEEEARLQKEKEEEEARLQKEKEEEEARLQKEKEEEEARLQKEKEEEEVRLQKEKEEEEARLQKEKEEEEARLQKEQEEEEARLQREKEEEEARLQKEKEEEEQARLQKEAEDKLKEEAQRLEEEKKKLQTLLEQQEERREKSILTIGDYGDLFETDVPFVTFSKMVDVLYAMLETMPEAKGIDPVRDRIQRAIYDKISSLIESEDPEALDEHLKDVLIVLAGKIAAWLKNILTESQIIFLDKYPAQVESVEVRDWTKWLANVSETASDWASWLSKVVEEAEGIREGSITRGDWHDWTKSVDIDALLWRRFHLQTIHQAHRNVTMMAQRQLVKTGTKTMDFEEKEIRNTNFQTVTG